MELFRVPQAGWTMESGTVSTWLKNEGEEVRQGEPILELETDKTIVEVEATVCGILARILLKAGETAQIGSPLAVITAAGEANDQTAIDDFLKTAVFSSAGTAKRPETDEVPNVKSATPAPSSGSQVKATPRVRKLAQELHVPLESVVPTGNAGTVTEDDVRSHASTGGGQPHAEPALRERVTLSGIRKAMSRHMAASWSTVPHFHQIIDIDAAPLLLVHKEQQLSLTPFLVKAAAVALSRHPFVNATTDGIQLNVYADINVGVAVGTQAGLITPVVRNADSRSVIEISADLQRLTQTANAGRLSPADVSGGTFTVSNLGMYGIETGTPIINAPQVALMFVGAIQNVAAWREGELVMAFRMKLTFAYDHRVIDGIAGARFSNEVRGLLEHPNEL